MIRHHSPLLNETYYETRLPSGFKIFLYPKAGRYNKAAFLSVGYGSLYQEFYDPSGALHTTPAGTAHFLEHKLFENESSDIFSHMSRLGATVNAYTAHENTCYYFTAPDKFEDSLRLLLELPIRREYSPAGVASERLIIEREIEMYLDAPDYRSYRAGLQALYPHHPIGQDIAGTKQSIGLITKQTLDLVMDQFYVPENMFLFVIGDFSPSDMARLIDLLPAYYHTARPRARLAIQADNSLPESDIILEHDAVAAPTFDYLLKLQPIADSVWAFRRYIKYQLILDILFGKGSVFFEDHYTNGTLSDLEAEYAYGTAYRYLSFSGEGQQPLRFKRQLEKQLKHFHETGVSVEEVERSRRKLMGQFLMGFNSLNNIALSFITLYYLKTHLFDYLEIVRTIELDDWQDLFHGAGVFSIIQEETV